MSVNIDTTGFTAGAIDEYLNINQNEYLSNSSTEALAENFSEVMDTTDENKLVMFDEDDETIIASEQELEEKRSELKNKKELLELMQSEYEKTLKSIEDNKEEYEYVQKAIEDAVSDYEESEKDNKKAAINEAMASYDEEKDGDWEDFLNGNLKDIAGNSAIQNLISSLSTLSADITTKCSSLEVKARNLKLSTDTLGSDISGLEADIASLEKTVGTTAGASVSSSMASNNSTGVNLSGNPNEKLNKINKTIGGNISEEEWALVEQNNIDLTEKLENGNPRYVFAIGQGDKEYHIYDMTEGTYGRKSCNSTNGYWYGTSIARLYGCKGGGIDIVPNGSGYTSMSFDTVGPGATCDVYWMDDCGSMESANARCCTCSPLSFDLNGDGVNVSSELIDYDIDGDGTIDTINDSLDAVLCFDKDGDGISGEDGSECFGDNTDLDGDGKKDGYSDGFEALKELARKEGLINDKDDMKLDENDIAYLEENYGFKIKTSGYMSEAISLKDAGITEINLADTKETTMVDNVDGKGNRIMYQQGATFKVNGEEREYADIWHKKQTR